MRDSTLQLLMAADDAVACEFPAGFDRAAALSRVQDLLPQLEAAAGRDFQMDTWIEDASHFAVLRSDGLGISFSCFGQLVAIETDPDDPPLLARVSAALAAAGFTPVDADEVDEPYTGANPHLAGQTWRSRFFSYL
jgi:hypothetical protein